MVKRLVKAVKLAYNNNRGVAYGLEGLVAKIIRANITKKERKYKFTKRVRL